MHRVVHAGEQPVCTTVDSLDRSGVMARFVAASPARHPRCVGKFPESRSEQIDLAYCWRRVTRHFPGKRSLARGADTCRFPIVTQRHTRLFGLCQSLNHMDVRVVAINLSLGQLRNGRELIRDVAETLAKWQLVPSDLEFDVTEATLAQMTWTHNDVLPRLRELGVRIAIDDFGTEYSSFEYLRAYRVNHLKIAQSMLERATDDPASAATVRAIVNLAREARIGIIVEGVETVAQRSFLNSIGPATLAQGYYFSEAVAAAHADKFLRSGVIGKNPQAREVAPEI